MLRWYAGFPCVGKPDVIVQQIGKKVYDLALGNTVPVVRLERRARGQFYLFLAIVSEQPGIIPQEAAPLLQLPYLKTRLPHAFTLDEIRSMVGFDIVTIDTGSIIPYHYTPPQPYQDPFQPSDIGRGGREHSQGHQHGAVFDRLLLWLSSTASGTWPTFQSTCQALGLLNSTQSAYSIVRRLRLLGHIECSPTGARWSAAPSALTRTSMAPGETITYVLCGQRSDELCTWLAQHAKVVVTPQEYGDAPSTVTVSTDNSDALDEALVASGLPGPPRVGGIVALDLARTLPTLDHWVTMLLALPGIEPALFDTMHFDGAEFVPAVFTRRSGFYQLWPLGRDGRTANRPKYTLFYEAATDRWLRGDWYGLRYLSRYLAGDVCPASYDPSLSRLAIPVEWRPPELYERALVLASGRLPSTSGPWLIYDHITPELLTELEGKLRMQPASLDYS